MGSASIGQPRRSARNVAAPAGVWRTARDDHAATSRAGGRHAVDVLHGRGRGVRSLVRGATECLAAGDPHALGHQRLVEGTVHVDRAGRRALGGTERSEPRASPFLGVLQHGRHGRFEVGPRVAAEELDLIDRLVRPGPAQVWGTVGREQEQGRPRLRCLHHGGEQFGGRGAARAHHGDGPPQRVGEPEPEEAARALVEVNVHLDPGVASGRQGERCGSRARGHAGVAHPAEHEFVDQPPGAREREVGLAHPVTRRRWWPGAPAGRATAPGRTPSADRRRRGRAPSR